jgi:hypothetical protein
LYTAVPSKDRVPETVAFPFISTVPSTVSPSVTAVPVTSIPVEVVCSLTESPAGWYKAVYPLAPSTACK